MGCFKIAQKSSGGTDENHKMSVVRKLFAEAVLTVCNLSLSEEITSIVSYVL